MDSGQVHAFFLSLASTLKNLFKTNIDNPITKNNMAIPNLSAIYPNKGDKIIIKSEESWLSIDNTVARSFFFMQSPKTSTAKGRLPSFKR